MISTLYNFNKQATLQIYIFIRRSEKKHSKEYFSLFCSKKPAITILCHQG